MKVKPLPGFMVVEVEPLFAKKGLIELPDTVGDARQVCGRIIAMSMRDQDRRQLGMKLSVGSRVLLSHFGGRNVSDTTAVYPILDALGIVPEGMDIGTVTQTIERCHWCGDSQSGVHQNIMLFNGLCPRCGKNRQGKVPSNDIKLSDDTAERLKRAM